MSAVASQVILNPSVSQLLSVLSTTVGREKTFRLFQYTARLLAWFAARRGDAVNADRFKGLQGGFSQARWGMRLFGPLQFLQTAIKLAQRPITSLSPAGQLAHATAIARQLSLGGFYSSEMLVWLGTVRGLRLDKTEITKWQRRGQKFWLTAILLSFVSTFASLVKLRADGRRFALAAGIARREASEKAPEERVREEEERREKGRALLTQRQTLLSQLIMDSLDVWIPATNVGFFNFNDGVLGFLGIITSYMHFQQHWAKNAPKKV